MPYSSTAFDHYVSTVIGLLQPQTVCDIGPGAGKYADIVRKAAELHGFAARMTAVEIDAAYVERFDLRSLYDEVILGRRRRSDKQPESEI